MIMHSSRRRFLAALAASPVVLALREIQDARAQLQFGPPPFEIDEVYSSSVITAGATYKHVCNDTEVCFNQNDGRCWYRDGAKCAWFNNSATCYINARCAYKKYDAYGNYTGKKYCDADSINCDRECYLCS